ncbi:MAG TPA: universal stress protein [Vicinamibacterales bacterium]|nr:universal stress protein [Vicinamibacterales bacterium]
MAVKHILVTTDFSPASQEAVHYACELAVSLGAKLHVLHVLENPFAPGAFMEMYSPPPAGYFTDLAAEAGARLQASLTEEERRASDARLTTRLGVPSSEILDRLHEEPAIDLVVMATHGRGGVARLVMGSVADKIVRAAPCPVLTLREHPLKGRDRQAAGAVVAGAGR